MKNCIVKNGLLGGLVVSSFMIGVSFYMKANPDNEPSMVLGFASMFLAFLFVVLGIKQQRDANNGALTFGKAFLTGIFISVIIATIYVIVWLIIYYNFFPDFEVGGLDFSIDASVQPGIGLGSGVGPAN